ncbi:hypothetical protein WJX73_007191 [Symbiochloris irregularis]|uniref:PH domain-containing protein n=1 Tax=Symbiochloris irregularis TaxID=706552 RepID=A0AAW1P0E1_9CHLO
MTRTSLDDAQDTPLPSWRSRQGGQSQIIVGVLNKWVNITKGWKDRLVVLQGTTLRYYKVGMSSRVNVHTILETLRRQGSVITVGKEVAVLESKHKSSSGIWRNTDAQVAQAEVILQDATLQASESDNKKFYLSWPDSVFRFAAETRDDRNSWIDALQKAMGTSNQPATVQQENIDTGLNQLLATTQQGLEKRGANADTLAYVQQVLCSQHQEYSTVLAAEANRRQKLLGHIRSLENEKRQLETSMVAEQELRNTAHRGPAGDDAARSELGSEAPSDADGDADSNNALDSPLADSSDEDIWHECSHTLPRSSMSGGGGGHELSHSDSDRGEKPEALTASTSGREDEDWLQLEGPAPKRRTVMPKPQQQEKSVSLWSIIKECVGKDLSKVCLPVYFNEPLSMLQRIAEELEYSQLLDQAAKEPKGSHERMMLIAAFAVSGYSGSGKRTIKPFNPLLGETFEFLCQEQGMRLLIEKVVHHPTVIAAHAWGQGWEFAGDVDLKNKFWGRSIELQPVGVLILTFADGEQFVWRKVNSSINNLIIGKIYIDHGGIMRIKNNSGLVCKLKFHETGMLTREAHLVKGHLEQDGDKLELPRVHGKWDDAMYAEMPDGSQKQLWKVNPLPEHPTRYNLTSFAMKLNELTPGLGDHIAPTDCRLRPDQRATEQGLYDQANSEKLRLEKKQRAARAAADRGDPIRPRWFEQVPDSERGEDSLAFRYSGGYWESRRKGHFEGCRDIFGQDVPAVPEASKPSQKDLADGRKT